MSESGKERFFGEDEIIVSKTDGRGRLTYINRLFCQLSDYSEEECLGSPHSIIRHPDMPRCIFYLLWERIKAGQEVFAYVKNRSKNNDYYWVIAHVTPSFDSGGNMIGYHSNRRTPNRQVLEEIIIPLYRKLLAEEQQHSSRKDGIQASVQLLNKTMQTMGKSYDEFIHSH